MSIQAMCWAIEQRLVSDSSARHVLLCLANYADKAGRGAFPSAGTLAEETGLSERTVRYKLDTLEREGVIRAGCQSIAAAYIDRLDRRPMVYDLAMDRGAEVAPRNERGAEVAPGEDATGCNPRQDGVQLTTPRGAAVAPKPSSTRTATDKALAPVALDFSSWPSEPAPQILADWLDLRKRKRAPITPTALRGMGAQLHRAAALGYDVNAALTECVLRGWQGLNADWLQPNQRAGLARADAPSKTFGAMQKLQGMKHGLAGNGASDRAAETAVLELGSDTGGRRD